MGRRKESAVAGKGVTTAQENYLEAMLLLQRREPVVRVRSLAQFLGVRMASVTGMLKNLAQQGLVTYKPYGHAVLTEEGEAVARDVLGRHNAIKDFLVSVLGVSSERAESAACRMEHVLDGELVRRFAKFDDFVRSCPRCSEPFLGHFVRFAERGGVDADECRSCLRKTLEEVVE